MEIIQESISQRHQAIRQTQLEIDQLETLKSLDCSLFQRKVLKLLVAAKKEEQKRINTENDSMVIIFENDTSKSLSSLNLFYIGSLVAMKYIDNAFKNKQEIQHSKTPMLFEIASLYIDFFTSLNQTQRVEDVKFLQTQKVPLLPLLLEALIDVSREQFEVYVMTQQDKFVKMLSQLKDKPQSKENEEQYPKNRSKSKQLQQICLSSQVELPSQLKCPETAFRQSFHRIKRRKDTNKLNKSVVQTLEDKEKQPFHLNKTFYQNNTKLNINQRIKRAFSQTEIQVSGAVKPIQLNGDKVKSTLQRWQLDLLNSVQDVLDLDIVNWNSDMINIYINNQSNGQIPETNIQNLVSYMISRNNQIKISIEGYINLRQTSQLSNKPPTKDKQIHKIQSIIQESKKNVLYFNKNLLVRPKTAFQSDKNEKVISNTSNQKRWNSINNRKGLSRKNSKCRMDIDSLSFYQGEISNGDIIKTNQTQRELNNFPIQILKGNIEDESQNQARVSQEKFIQRMRSTNKIQFLCNTKNRSRTAQGPQDNHYQLSSFSDLHFPNNSKNTSNSSTCIQPLAKDNNHPTNVLPQTEIQKEEGFITEIQNKSSTLNENQNKINQSIIKKIILDQVSDNQPQPSSQEQQVLQNNQIQKNPLSYIENQKKRSMSQVGESAIPQRTLFYKAKANNYKITGAYMNYKTIDSQIAESINDNKQQKQQILAKVDCFSSKLNRIEKEQQQQQKQNRSRQLPTPSIVFQNKKINSSQAAKGQSIAVGILEILNFSHNGEVFKNKKEYVNKKN